jgi:phosphopantetheinyl transferase
MPLYLHQKTAQFELAVWHITEQLEDFAQLGIEADADIVNTNKKLQWCASRYLTRLIAGSEVELTHDEFGRPHFSHNRVNISISHSNEFAAIIISNTTPVGIDIEPIHPKVERVAHKFMHEEELARLEPETRIVQLITYWSAKEALYKLYGKKQLTFKTQLRIAPFNLAERGTLNGAVYADDWQQEGLEMPYSVFENHVLVYVLGR